MSNEKRLWIIEARDGACGANGICKGELVRCKDCKHNIGEKVWSDERDEPKPYTINCDCGYAFYVTEWFETKDEAIAAWNRRVESDERTD